MRRNTPASGYESCRAMHTARTSRSLFGHMFHPRSDSESVRYVSTLLERSFSVALYRVFRRPNPVSTTLSTVPEQNPDFIGTVL